MTAIALQRKAEILERVAIGHKLVDIGRDIGVTQPAISQQLAKLPEYRAARESGTLARIEAWEKEIEAIDANTEAGVLMLARAREMLSHARWRAEREFPERWGQKQEQAQGAVTIVIQRFGDTPVIEGATVHTLPDNS